MADGERCWRSAAEASRTAMLHLAISILVLIAAATICRADTDYNCECMQLSQCSSESSDFAYHCEEEGKSHLFCCMPAEKEQSKPSAVKTETKSGTSLLPEDCSRVDFNNRITEGQNATLGQYPWMALLGYKQKGIPVLQHYCGGTLINSRYILTSAHCFNVEGFEIVSVRLGEFNIEATKDCMNSNNKSKCSDTVVDVPVEKIITHPNYTRVGIKNDIGLIRLADVRLNYTEYIQPICLPLKRKLETSDYVGKKFEVAGWGKTDSDHYVGSPVLQYAEVSVWDSEKCNKVVPPKVKPITEKQLCANGPSGQDSCNGDSGGPLMNVTYTGNLIEVFQVGIVSFAPTVVCGISSLPSVYTRVDQYIDWIVANVEP